MTRQATNVLLVDEGNTFVKWAIFNSNMGMISGTEKSITARFLNKLKKENPSLDTLFISSVRTEGLSKVVKHSDWKLLELNAKLNFLSKIYIVVQIALVPIVKP